MSSTILNIIHKIQVDSGAHYYYEFVVVCCEKKIKVFPLYRDYVLEIMCFGQETLTIHRLVQTEISSENISNRRHLLHRVKTRKYYTCAS